MDEKNVYPSLANHDHDSIFFPGPSTSQQPSTSKLVVARKKSTAKVHTHVPTTEAAKTESIKISRLSRSSSHHDSTPKLNFELRRTPSSSRDTNIPHSVISINSETPKRVEFSIVDPNGSSDDLHNQESTTIKNDVVENERPAWENKIQCFLSIIGFCVGLGNIWRFPYLCQQNGGGAFLIPYAIFLVLEGVPLFLIELGMGQKFRKASLGAWKTVHPWSAGIGLASCIVALSVALYYNIIIAWVLFYLYQSLASLFLWKDLPWASCPMIGNITIAECARSSQTAYFWYRSTLDISSSIDDGNALKEWIVFSFICSWLLVFLVVMKGINSSKYVVYFTSVFPFIILFIFLGRGLFLEGAVDGLKHMFNPRIEMLTNAKIWLDAATQVFYSFGLAFGSLIAFGSYNEPKNNCVRDVIYITICNAFTAILATTVVFSFLGYKAMKSYKNCLFEKSLNLTQIECNLDEQLNNEAEGTGMAFIVFAQAILELPGSQIWSVAFFLMLLSLGLGSQIGILEGALSIISEIKWLQRFKKPYITGVISVACFLIGLLFCTGSGEYWVQMFDNFAGTIGLVFIAFMELVVIGFVYDSNKFSEDIYDMTGYKLGLVWKIVSKYVGPIMTAVVLISNFYNMMTTSPKYKIWNRDQGKTVEEDFPTWVLSVAFCIVVIGIAPIILVYLVYVYKKYVSVRFNWRKVLRRNETTVSTRAMMESVDAELDKRENGQEDVRQRKHENEL